MGYDLEHQGLGDHDVTVDTVDVIEEGVKLVVKCRFRFKDGEIGNKDLYPINSEKSAQLTRKALSAMGFSMDDRDLGEPQKNPAMVKGNAVRVVVQENEYNGNTTNRIAFVNAIPKPASRSLLDKANAKLKAVKKDQNTSEEL